MITLKLSAFFLFSPEPPVIYSVLFAFGILLKNVLINNIILISKERKNTMAKKQFKAESKRLLDLMINSIYTHKEIFLRELISNASDALDKLYYGLLTEDITGISRDDFYISLSIDSENRSLAVSDNGIGMDRDELENNLGTIARSGSMEFRDTAETKDEIDIIGQFGVGFYSSFMAASRVVVISRKYGSDTAYRWESEGADGYSITECEKDEHGTEIILYIKTNTEDENYDDFLSEYRVQALVRKYSDYIRYPIKMDIQKSRQKEGSSAEDPEYEDYTETEILNSMVPIWKKLKNEITDEDYSSFYKEKFFDYEDPLKIIHSSTEGLSTYNALMFVPKHAPYNFYTKEYEKGLQLYASGVLIMEKCSDLLSDYFGFIKGVVDSQDLSLNISREMLQHDRQLKLIASNLEKKIKSELENMLKNDREKYEEFFAQFGLTLKYGLYSEYGRNKDLLKDLIIFSYSGERETITLKEYVSEMKEDQKYIYYASGDSIERIKQMPQTEIVTDKGMQILYLTDDVDEFALKMLNTYEEKEFRSVSSGDLGFEDENSEDESGKTEANKDLFEYMQSVLEGKVKEVRASQRLKSHPVCLTSGGDISIEMEKILSAMPANNDVKAERILEINEEHKIFDALKESFISDKDKLAVYTRILYNQALLIEGLAVEDPLGFTNEVCELIIGN